MSYVYDPKTHLYVARYSRVYEVLCFPLGLVIVTGYVAWRALTCAVDSWADYRAGRVPLWRRPVPVRTDDEWRPVEGETR